MQIIKKILETFFLLLGLFMCVIGLYLIITQIIENPAYVPYYVGIIFLFPISIVLLFAMYSLFNLPLPHFKPKPKTFSKYLVMWLLSVFFVCGLGSALIWWGFTVAERLHGLLMAFAIIVSVLGAASFGALIWQLITCLKNKFILKHGVETEATFIECAYSFDVHFGKDIGGTTIFQYYVKFKFFNGEKEITVKSNTVYTEEEAEYFKQTEKFLVKYKGKRAVISQLPE